MKILVIGGSYFLGRVFTMLAAPKEDVTVLNRGTYSMESFGAKCVKADRHDGAALRVLANTSYDVVVDFCAYRQGDIAGIVNCPGLSIGQYILISTVDVYEKWTRKPLAEDAPLQTRRFGGETGEYIWQKLLLEQELAQTCRRRDTAPTCIRPALLYGPFNYAARESEYVRRACTGETILCPTDAAGRFQPVYVKDAAAMILALCQNPAAYHNAYNIAGDAVDYETFLDTFANACGQRANIIKLPAKDAAFCAPDAFLPFPFTAEETEFYDGQKIISATGLSFTPLEEGLRKTWQVFSKLYDSAFPKA